VLQNTPAVLEAILRRLQAMQDPHPRYARPLPQAGEVSTLTRPAAELSRKRER
jgi:hypothetical protein